MNMMDNIITFLLIMQIWVLGLSAAWFVFDKIFPDESETKRGGF